MPWLPNGQENGEGTAQSAGCRRWAMQATAHVPARAETRLMVRLGIAHKEHASKSVGVCVSATARWTRLHPPTYTAAR